LVYRIVRDDGDVRWIRDRAFPIRDQDGRVSRIAGLAEDVTERRRIEEGLRQTRDTLQAVIDATPVSIMALDIEGRVTLWNPASERIFGYSAEDAEGAVPPIVPPERRDEHRRLLQRALGGERHEGVEIRRRRKDGQEVDLLLYTAPTYGWEGEVTGVVAALLDVTERKALEGQLREAAKMEAIGRLAGGIAHDFNNLLTAIGGYADLLLTEEEPPWEWVEEIREASAQAARLTSQLLAFSRRQVVQKTTIDPGAVIREMEAILSRLVGERLELSIEIADDLGTVLADRGQVEQVVMNLVVNARDAMPEGGRVRIVAENREIDRDVPGGPDPGGYVRLAVRDTGPGMEPETVERAFEPFFTTKKLGEGTGLGLATVYGIARQSGGDARIETEPGEGTTVEVLIPRAAAESPEEEVAEPRAAVAGAGGGERILVVEDDDRVRRLATRILVADGYRVRTARTVEEGRTAADEQPVDLLLSDVVLPDGTGDELASELQERDPSLRIVLMSGYPDLEIRHASGSGSLDEFEGAFLQKPFAAKDLLERIRRELDR
ncbi:MAG: PAS domain S-box protein, partial [Gemmatimonadota bacterium]|nr:PAS domain S-box protein [Gemmatimonadota bacterium]